MPWKFGEDFDAAQPANTDMVKLGAHWIRDIKARLKNFLSAMFDLETGDFRDSVIRTESLVNSGVTANTYNKVTVNSKGIVVAGDNVVDETQVALYRARFETAGATIDTETGVTSDTPDGGGTYTGTGVYRGTYSDLSGCSYVTYTWQVPQNVTRIKVYVAGGGGGGGATGTFGGGGSEYAEAVLPVTPGQNVGIVVGSGGAQDQHGAPSGVDADGAYVEADGGTKATASAGGVSGTGSNSTNVGVLRCIGDSGDDGVRGLGGSVVYVLPTVNVGAGGSSGTPGEDGMVILEWVA